MVSVDKGDFEHLLVSLESAGIGFLTAVELAGAKTNASAPLDIKVMNMISRIIGVDFTAKLFNKNRDFLLSQGASLSPTFTPFGILNQSTIGGGLIFGVDALLEHFDAGKMGYNKVRKYILGAAVGLLAGGIFGGLIDPANGGAQPSSSYIQSLPSVNRSVLS